MTVQVFALATVAAQLVSARKVALDHHFKLSRHICSLSQSEAQCPTPFFEDVGNWNSFEVPLKQQKFAGWEGGLAPAQDPHPLKTEWTAQVEELFATFQSQSQA